MSWSPGPTCPSRRSSPNMSTSPTPSTTSARRLRQRPARRHRQGGAGLAVNEREVIARLKRIATDPAARGLADDAALLDGLVITHDTHRRRRAFPALRPAGFGRLEAGRGQLSATSPPRGRGRAPPCCRMAIGDADWDEAFLDGIEAACESYGVAADRRRHHRLAGRRAARARPDRHRQSRRAHARRAPADRPATGCGWSGHWATAPPASRNCRTTPRPTGLLVDHLSPAGAAARCRPGAGGKGTAR